MITYFSDSPIVCRGVQKRELYFEGHPSIPKGVWRMLIGYVSLENKNIYAENVGATLRTPLTGNS